MYAHMTVADISGCMADMWPDGRLERPKRLTCDGGGALVHMHPYIVTRSSLVGKGLGLFFLSPTDHSLPKGTMVGVFSGVWTTNSTIDKLAARIKGTEGNQIKNDYAYGYTPDGGVAIDKRIKVKSLAVMPNMCIEGDTASLRGPASYATADYNFLAPGIDAGALIQSVPTDHESQNCDTIIQMQEVDTLGSSRPMLGIYTTREVKTGEELLLSYRYVHDPTTESIAYNRWLDYRVPASRGPVNMKMREAHTVSNNVYFGSAPLVPESAAIHNLRMLVAREYGPKLTWLERSAVMCTAACDALDQRQGDDMDVDVFDDWLRLMNSHMQNMLQFRTGNDGKLDLLRLHNGENTGALVHLATAVNYVMGPTLKPSTRSSGYVWVQNASARWAIAADNLDKLAISRM